MIRPRFLLSVFLLLGFYPWRADAQQAADFFQQRCTMCHTIGGGRLVGPDLKDVMKRKDRAWLERFVQNPKAVIDSGDPYALQLQQNSRGIVMPTLPGVTPEMAKSLLDLIDGGIRASGVAFHGKEGRRAPLHGRRHFDWH